MTRSVLVYRPGNLGDTLVAVPALWAVRRHFAASRITLLFEVSRARSLVTPAEPLRGSGICDEFLSYPVGGSWLQRLQRPLDMATLQARVRSRRIDTLVYLAPSRRTMRQRSRDRLFFRAAGVTRFIGMEGFPPPETWLSGARTLPSEGELLLRRLERSGVPVPEAGRASLELSIGQVEERRVADWMLSQPNTGGRLCISIGPGGKQPVTRWPIERYQAVVAALIARFDVWPIVFGAPADAANANRLLRAWARGWDATGFDVRTAIAAMRRCVMHLGNDTGTIHMAAAAGVPCVGVYAAQNPRGQWEPYGAGHRVLRLPIDCEGCLLEECVAQGHRCLLSIGVEPVTAACEEMLVRVAAADQRTTHVNR